MVKMNNSRSVNRIVAQEAKPAVAEEALKIGVRAEAILNAHRKHGTHHIEVSQGRVDSFVSLVGPAALAVEEGHYSGYKGKRKHVDGIHALRRAAGL